MKISEACSLRSSGAPAIDERIRYQTAAKGEVKITNEADVECHFRYPDLTYQCIYLSNVFREAL